MKKNNENQNKSVDLYLMNILYCWFINFFFFAFCIFNPHWEWDLLVMGKHLPPSSIHKCPLGNCSAISDTLLTELHISLEKKMSRERCFLKSVIHQNFNYLSFSLQELIQPDHATVGSSEQLWCCSVICCRDLLLILLSAWAAGFRFRQHG